MRLINTKTYKLEDFIDPSTIKYAILSHRWEDEEVSFLAMAALETASRMKGFGKIWKSCQQAAKDGYKYVWVDTCCINKESSAELSEALNSMFRWYNMSAVCYAFLSDVSSEELSEDGIEGNIKRSMWFTRGWTLQELIAPQNMRFYDKDWGLLGTKETIRPLLSERTGIDSGTLSGGPLNICSIAQRMSWASQRVTTRVEDKAYCLMGIFEVNMPMLYGEGNNAFFRLQQEIIKYSDDHTIFAWPICREDQPGLLADGPEAFAGCHSMRQVNVREGRTSYSLTNRGLSIKLPVIPWTTDVYLVRLDCIDEQGLATGPDNSTRLGMFLKRLNEDDQYARVKHQRQTFLSRAASDSNISSKKYNIAGSSQRKQRIEMNIRQQITIINAPAYKNMANGFRIASPELLERSSLGEDRFTIVATIWNADDCIMSNRPGFSGTTGLLKLDITQQNQKIKVIKLGFDFDFNPVYFIATLNGLIGTTPVDYRPGYSEEREIQFLSIYQRHPSDLMGWSTTMQDVSCIVMNELEFHPGLWAMKVDRVNGLDVRIGDLAALKIVRGAFQDGFVWEVLLDYLPNFPAREKDKGLLKRLGKGLARTK